MSNPTTILIGFLGKDRETRTTRERTYTKTVHNKVIDGDEEIEVHLPSRTYMKLSLATQERSATGPVTHWHDLILWNPSAEAFLARKGDQIKVTGRREEYEFETADGETRTGVHFVVQSLRFVHRKIRQQAA
ncbi:MAG TPA: single-stranded DNA-binding protein [Thermoanaerobaculia bacterium]|jgi:single-stranded DNA-binding protein|nr:single-stranded DNA-binding protein [Thermoanaerobaculia bacterium]